MSDYTITTDFSVKDALPSGVSEKIILGADVDVELTAIQTAIASKVDEPSSPSTNDVLTWDGAAVAWAAPAASLPVGSIVAYGGVTEPSGWLMCDGRSLAQVGTYADLYAVIGTAYGNTAGGANFNLPDLRFRGPIGPDDMGTAAGAASRGSGVSASNPTGRTAQSSPDQGEGQTGGAGTKTLTTTELPAHTHSFSATTSSSGAHTHTVSSATTNSDTSGGGYANVTPDSGSTLTTSSSGAHTHTVSGTSGSAGSGSAYDNMNPFQVMGGYIIKY